MINGSLPFQGKKTRAAVDGCIEPTYSPTGGEFKKGLCFFSHLLGEDFQFSSVQNAGWLFYIGDCTTHLYGDFFRSQQK